VDAEPGQGVEVGGKRGDERFPFARLHLGDPSLVEDDASQDLDIEMAHLERPAGRLADAGERLDENVVQGSALSELFLELGRLRPQLVVGEGLDRGFEGVDGRDDGPDFLQDSVVVGPENFLEEPLIHFLIFIRKSP